ncbi:hypothetical protein ABEB36_005415 [Hypothenemus hampei]|uniref:DNA/RNA non-specific endonuclease/pyrophosphatase/phosphodiesterase domain-containing protein n=1 Tax=Hypothenemus hampei TaxID=57062 RepID=A0ABD1EY65_HYPHA
MFYLLIIFFQLIYEISCECVIVPVNIKPTPLVIHSTNQIAYSPAFLKRDENITITCPGNQVLYEGTRMGEVITITCGNFNTFMYGDQELQFHSLACEDIPRNTIRYTGEKCLNGNREIEIGYLIPNYGFLRQILICFDAVYFSPIYSHFNLTSTILTRDSRVPRKFFEESGFYVTYNSLDNLYRRDKERETINQQLELDRWSDKFIKNDDRFINRGHLTSKGDFVYAFQQLATFHYVNSAPQWASFNGGNWNEVEISVRELASTSSKNLEIYTGVYGTMSLPNQRHWRKVPLFLHNIQGKKLLPIPQLFWKLIYDRTSDKGIVIVGVNNIYELNMTEDVVCLDIGDRISWFNRKLQNQKHNIELGYIYACSVNDFCKKTNYCPNLNVNNLLL